ncbi:MAG: cytochrome d ubiquinol oxidase subunit II [Acidobacteria bacterium]|nr:cytochrome d ubiquinol oxidase subunit II [Acidobacteriota bacterium]
MEILWFWLVAIMIAGYVVLDGFDLGAGILHLCVARSDAERRIVLRSIGPVWDGNEVWLLAGGGTLYFAFPSLYASSFSGFYLPLMMVLWLLILRAISIEFRNHIDSPAWTPIWDAVFFLASALLAIFFGAALGNVVRGVPLNPRGEFFLPLWTDFQIGPEPGILDWYTVLVGLFAFATLTLHGARWLVLKTEGGIRTRAEAVAGQAWRAVLALTILTTLVTFRIQPHIPANFTRYPAGYLFPLLALAGLADMRLFARRGLEMQAFLSSCLYIVGMLTSAVFGVFPYVLPSVSDPQFGLTVYNASTAPYGLAVGLAWWIPGMLLVGVYHFVVYRHFAGKVR